MGEILLENGAEISRQICREPATLPELRASINEIACMTKSDALIFTGGILAAGSFSLFFGGTLDDSVVAAIFAVFVTGLQKYLGRTEINTTASNLLVSLLLGLFVGILCKICTFIHMDKILIGDIMLLIPGLAMTNAVRNILVGNTLSGVIRLIECFIWALALAGGFMTAMLIIDTILL